MISQNKINHMLGVARRCQEIAEKQGFDDEMQNACFVMGLLHDIGYEHCSKKNMTDHPEESRIMICDFLNHKDSVLDAIGDHGTKYENLSTMDMILNLADLTIDYSGKTVTIDKRLEDIKQTHGETTTHYQHALTQAKVVQELAEKMPHN